MTDRAPTEDACSPDRRWMSYPLFFWRQVVLQRRDDALLDLRVFRSANFSLSIALMGLLSVAFFGVITIVPLYLQGVLQVSALDTGIAVLPGALVMGLSAPIIGRVYDKRGPRVLLVPGAIIASAALWTYTTFGATTPLWLVAATQTVLSLALALSFTPLFTASLGSVQPRFYSYGSAVLGTVQQVAGAVGIALMVTVYSAVSAAHATGGSTPSAAGAAGAQSAFLIGAIVSLPIIAAAFFIRKPEDMSAGAPGAAGLPGEPTTRKDVPDAAPARP